MTTIHKESSHTTKKFSSTSGNDNCRGRNSAKDFWDFDLPIRRKGRFFQDSSFQHERDEFDAAVRNVLKRWGEKDLISDAWDDTGLRSSNNLNRYRKMRAHNLREDNQAVTITDDDTCHKIMLDVHDFMEGEMKVKLVGERELVVEGHMGSAKHADLSLASQNFRRRFSLPDLTDMDAITSVMSSDGILTITAPKIVNRAKEGSTIPVNVAGNTKSNVTQNYSSTSTTKTSSDNSRLAETQQECDCQDCRQKYGAETATTTTTTQQSQHKVPININETLTENQRRSQTQEAQLSSDCVDRNTEGKSTYANTKVDNNDKLNQYSDQREHVSNASRSTSVASDTQHSAGKQGTTETKAHSQKSTSTRSEFRDSPFSMRDSLPIKRKGHFFDDSFFDDTRTGFHKALNDILREWGETDLLSDTWDDSNLRQTNNLSRYRKLRAHNLKEDNQAVTVTDDNTCHKIVLDVQDFMEGDVQVKLVGEKELVVEGHMGSAKHADLSLASQNFRRRFSLPDLTDMDAITSVMSSDGILTITAPKIVSQVKEEDFTIPVTVNETAKTQAKEHCCTTSISQATSDNSTSSRNSTLEDKQEAECQKNESRQNISFSAQQKEEKSTPVKISVAAEVNDETSAATDASHKSSERLTSQETLQSSASTSSQANTVNQKACEKTKDQSEEKQNVSDISTQTSFTSSSKMCEEKQSAGEFVKGTLLPIKTRGLFFNDSIFEDTWKDYQDAVKDVVVKWGDHSTSDDMTCYRKLRTRDMKEENQAVKTSEDEFNYKFVVDVQDFVKDGEITVKAVDERELVVEGRVQRGEGGSSSTKRFLRRFVLPDDAQLESVSSVMSSDGVLTIMAPKKPWNLQGKAEAEPASVRRAEESRENVCRIREESVRTGTPQPCPSVRSKNAATSLGSSMSSDSTTSSSAVDESCVREESSSRHSSSVSSSANIKASSDEMGQARGHAVPIGVDVQEVETAGYGDASKDNWNLNSENTQKKNVSCKIRIDYEDDDIDREATGSRNFSYTDEDETDAIHRRLEREQGSSKGQGEALASHDMVAEAGGKTSGGSQQYHVEFDDKYKNRLLPITTKGLFSDDSFFRDCRMNFKAAVKEVLQKAQETPSDDEISAYRSLRRRNLKLENQAVHVDEDLSYQTIVLDVYDFLGGEVTVRVVEGKELVVEGRAKRREGTSMTTLSFVRRFPLPDLADLEFISAVMASDGVLVIGVPKLRRYAKVGGRNRDLSGERQSRLESELEGGWKGRESSRESQGRSSHSMSSRLRGSPDVCGEGQWRGSHREAGRSWEERNMRDSSTDSEGSPRAFRRRHHHQHFTSDLF